MPSCVALVHAICNWHRTEGLAVPVHLDMQETSILVHTVVADGSRNCGIGRDLPHLPLSPLPRCLHLLSALTRGKEAIHARLVLNPRYSLSRLSLSVAYCVAFKAESNLPDENARNLIEESIAARRLELERPVIVQLLANVRVHGWPFSLHVQIFFCAMKKPVSTVANVAAI